TVRAARLTQLPAVYVNVADSVSHPLGIYTNSTHLVQATTASGSTFQLLGTTLLNTTSGLATFSNLSILDPSTGTVQLTFSDMEHQWNAYLYFTVVEGEPHQMYFVRYPSNATTNVNPTLSIQPVVGILDASGNPLTSLTDKSVDIKTITLEYWYHDLNDQVVVRVVAVSALNAQFRVEGVSITGKHEEPYYLNFSSDLLPVPVLISDAIVVGWCETTEFAIANSTACEACPANAVCDGTFEIRAQDNWWRADNTTLVFYSCGAPYSGDSCYDNGECRPGYSGPRCSLCEQGFGKSGRFCERCQSSDTNNAIVLIACVALLCLVTLMVYTIVMTSSKDLVPVLFRNLVTYIQILARLSDTNMPWPATLDDLWRFISSIANLQAIDFSPFDCAMKVNFFEKYIVTLLIPWFMIVLVAPLAIIVVKLYTKEDETTATALDVAAACRKEEDESLLHEITEATAQRRVTMIGEPSRRFPASNPLDAKQADVLSPGLASVLHNDVLKAVAEGEARKRLNDWSEEALTKNRIDHVAHILSMRHARYTTGAVIVITAVTIFTLLYPTLVQSSGQVLQCESMDLGRQGVVSLSSNQRDVSCSSAYFKFYATLAISMIMVYGVSIPFGLIVVVLLLQRWGGMSLARAVLAFTMAGLKPELWFWETVNMMRKFLSMMVVVFVSDAKLQMIVFMWVTVIGFVLNVTFSPYTSRLVYLLECLGMAATVATMNLVLMFFFFSSASNSADVYEGWGAAALSAGIIAVNAVAILSYLAAIAKHSWIRFTKWRGSRANEDALEEAVQNRMLSMKDVVEEVRTLRSRRSELDAAIQAIEERLDDVLEEDTASPTYHSNSGLVNWQFPTDENPFGGDEEVSEGDEETPSEEDGGGESVDAKGAPTRESSRRTTVTFTAEAPEKAASNRRRSMWKRAVSQRAALKDFSIASQHDFVQRNSSANLHAWVDPEPAVSADPTAKDPLAGSKGPDQPQTYLDGKELLAALGEDDEQSPLHLPKHSLFGAFRRTLRGGSDSDMEKSPSPSPKGPQAHQYGGVLSAEALRRMQQDDRVASPLPQVQMQVPGDSLGSGQWKQLNPNMLLDSNTSSSDRGGMTPKRLIPLPRKAVAERVQSWQQELTVGDEVDSPTTQSVRFDHHYMRDEEAEMEFLEGKIDQPPPPIRAVFLPPPRNDFSFLAEIENLDKHISDGMDLPSNAALEAQRVAQPPVRPFDPSAFLIPDLEEYEEPVPVIAQRVLRGAETLPAARLAASGITTNSRTPNKPMRKRSGKKMDFLLMMGASSESEEGDESGQEQPRHDRFSLGLQPMPVLQRLGETSGVGQLPSEDFRMSAVGAQDMTDNVLGQDFLMSILSPSKPITSAPEPPGSISSILQRTLTSRLRSMRDSKAAQSSSSEAPRKDDAFEGAASSGNSAVEIGDTSTHSRSHSAKRPQVTFEVVETTLPSNPVLSPLSADGFSQPAGALAGSLSLGTHPLLDIGEDVHHVPRGVSYEAPVDMETALQRIFDSSQPTPPPGTTTALGLPDRPHAFDSSEWSAEGAELDTPIVDPISVPIFVDDFVSTTMEREPSTLFEYNIPVARAMPTAAEMFPKTSTDAHKPRRGFHSTKLSDAEQELPVPKLLPKRHTHQSFDPERFFDGLLDFKEDPLPTKVQPGFLQLKSVSKATVLPTAKNPLGAPPPVQEPPKVPPLRNFETRSGVAAFLDHDEETPQHDYPQPAFLTSEEPWFARNPVTAQLVASPLITRPTFTDHPSRAQTERKERRKSNVLGGSRFRSTTSRSSLRPSTTSETHRPLSPLVVDWEDDDG
ncbi:transmembrane protein, putative, partial [Bodo saltans]